MDVVHKGAEACLAPLGADHRVIDFAEFVHMSSRQIRQLVARCVLPSDTRDTAVARMLGFLTLVGTGAADPLNNAAAAEAFWRNLPRDVHDSAEATTRGENGDDELQDVFAAKPLRVRLLPKVLPAIRRPRDRPLSG